MRSKAAGAAGSIATGIPIWKVVLVIVVVGAMVAPSILNEIMSHDNAFDGKNIKPPTITELTNNKISTDSETPLSPPPGPSPLATIFSDGFETDLG